VVDPCRSDMVDGRPCCARAAVLPSDQCLGFVASCQGKAEALRGLRMASGTGSSPPPAHEERVLEGEGAFEISSKNTSHDHLRRWRVRTTSLALQFGSNSALILSSGVEITIRLSSHLRIAVHTSKQEHVVRNLVLVDALNDDMIYFIFLEATDFFIPVPV
jgi:hypothetical protein